MRLRYIQLCFILTFFCCSAHLPAAARVVNSNDSISNRNIIQKIIDYFDDTNKAHDYKDFDFSIIGGPHYSSDTKLGIGLVGSGLYRTDKADSILPPSNVSIYFDGTTSKFFELGVSGTNISKGDKYRTNYEISFYSVSTKFWGIGYNQGYNDANESDYKYFSTQATADFTRRIGNHIYIGPMVTVDYINGRDFEKPELLNGQDNRTFNLGVGLTMTLDTRDNLTGATKGVHIQFAQRFNPRFLANRYAFSLSEFTASSYNRLWRGAILASIIHSRITYGNTPWGLMSTLGGTNMRGYFEGRYRDKSEIDLCVELRQHVWRRNGIVVWGGAASVFDNFSDITISKILPNYGFGYRWEFKQNVNVRLDLGFGRNQTGFIFSINEAF